MEVTSEPLSTHFQAAAKKQGHKYLDSIKYLQGDEIKKVLEYNKQEGKIHGIQSKQESERHRSRDFLV